MILERKPTVNLYELREQFNDILTQVDSEENAEDLDSLLSILELQHVYSAAMNEVSTKLEILDDEFQISHLYNPIHHLECRVKEPRSLLKKMRKKNYEMSVKTAKEKILDIAGIRVICNYIEDVYTIEELLLKQSDIQLLKRKDYLKNPKPNGYRSLHIVVTVPVFLSDSTKIIPVEIQIRTIAMDMWASLEHKLNYKNNQAELRPESIEKLYQAAQGLTKIEQDMQEIHHEILEQKRSEYHL